MVNFRWVTSKIRGSFVSELLRASWHSAISIQPGQNFQWFFFPVENGLVKNSRDLTKFHIWTQILLWYSQLPSLDILFCQITTFIKVWVAFVFVLHTFCLIDFTKIYPLKRLKPINKGHINFYEHCDLMKSISNPAYVFGYVHT